MPEEKKGNRNALDPAIPLYIERILAEETCGVPPVKGKPNKGWLNAGQISRLLKDRYGVECGRESIAKRYLPALERYYDVCGIYDAPSGSLYSLKKKRNGGPCWYKLESRLGIDNALLALSLADGQNDLGFISDFVLNSFGSSARMRIMGEARPYIPLRRSSFLRNNLRLDATPPERDRDKVRDAFKCIKRAIEENRLLCCKKIISEDSGTLSVQYAYLKLTGSKEMIDAERAGDHYEVTDVLYPVDLLSNQGTSLTLVAINASDYLWLTESKLPDWTDSPTPVWPNLFVWPDRIKWPEFERIPIEFFDEYKFEKKVEGLNTKLIRQIRGLYSLSEKIKLYGDGGKPLLVEVSVKAMDPDRAYRKHQEIRSRFKDFLCFNDLGDGRYQFVIAKNDIVHWCLKSDWIQVHGPDELMKALEFHRRIMSHPGRIVAKSRAMLQRRSKQSAVVIFWQFQSLHLQLTGF